MMYSIAIILVIISMASTEIPQQQQQQQQQENFASQPYVARGWRPLGQQLNLPQKLQQQQQQQLEPQVYGTPPQTYGVPQQEYGPPSEEFEPTTTQSTLDDEEQQAEDIRISQPIKASEQLKTKSTENLENVDEQINPSKGQYLIVLPQQTPSLFYTTNLQPQSAALVSFDGKANLLTSTSARLQTVPILTPYANGAVYQIY